MKQIGALLLILCIVLSLSQGQLLKPEQKKMTLKSSFFKNLFHSQLPLNITTQCNSVNLTEYNGLTLSGYLNVGIQNSSSALGFIFYGAKGVPAQELRNRPTIFWLNGGPGCSSQFGNFNEIGPLQIIQLQDGTFKFKANEYSWTNEYNNIFIDQPIGTGISYAEQEAQIPVNQDQVASQFYYALNQLYESKNGCFNQLQMNNSTNTNNGIFIYGESYAGKYIPSIAKKIVEEGNKYNLKGIGIGDGFTSPYFDTQAINQYSFDQGLIDENQYKKNLNLVKATQKALNESQWDTASELFNSVLSASNPNDLNVYNIFSNSRRSSSSSPLENFFNSQFGQNLFSLQLSSEYQECVGSVYAALSTDFMQGDCVAKVDYLLQQGINVHVFNGDLDLIVPYYAPQLWINTLTWSGIQQFREAEVKIWRNGTSVYGSEQQYENLTFTIVINSGHMVPEDQPVASLSLINNAINYTFSRSNKPKQTPAEY